MNAPSSVTFVAAPFLSVIRPSLGISNLKAGLSERGIASRILYYNIEFAEIIGVRLNELICEGWPYRLLAGEWVFADLLHRTPNERRDRRYLEFLAASLNPKQIAALQQLRPLARRFVDRAAEEIVAARPALVALTTMFHQNCASLAIADRVKRLEPSLPICLGGANCQGPMGTALFESFPQIDFLFLGESDFTFPEFVSRLLHDQDYSIIPGFLYRAGSRSTGGMTGGISTARPPADNLDTLPLPDFTDFFAAIAQSTLSPRVTTSLPIETSRGCWWGAKHHCRFCGLNGAEMAYRSKSGARILEEVDALSRRHGVKRFAAVDNILNMKHIAEVFDFLASSEASYRFFYEVKSNINRDQLKRIARGGVTWIQPGIESLDDEILRIMDKGVTGLQNIMLLRNCAEIGIKPIWSILWGFPGERPDQYHRMARILPLLEHLDPPSDCVKISLDRFSPYFERAAEFGFCNVRPAPAYELVYDLPSSVIRRLAYAFDGESVDAPTGQYASEVRRRISEWRNKALNHGTVPILARFEIGEFTVVKDTRSCAVETWRCLEPEEDSLLGAFRTPVPAPAALRRLRDRGIADEALREVFARLVAWGYVVQDGDRALSVVVDDDDRVHGAEQVADCPLGWTDENAGDCVQSGRSSPLEAMALLGPGEQPDG